MCLQPAGVRPRRDPEQEAGLKGAPPRYRGEESALGRLLPRGLIGGFRDLRITRLFTKEDWTAEARQILLRRA